MRRVMRVYFAASKLQATQNSVTPPARCNSWRRIYTVYIFHLLLRNLWPVSRNLTMYFRSTFKPPRSPPSRRIPFFYGTYIIRMGKKRYIAEPLAWLSFALLVDPSSTGTNLPVGGMEFMGIGFQAWLRTGCCQIIFFRRLQLVDDKLIPGCYDMIKHEGLYFE